MLNNLGPILGAIVLTAGSVAGGIMAVQRGLNDITAGSSDARLHIEETLPANRDNEAVPSLIEGDSGPGDPF